MNIAAKTRKTIRFRGRSFLALVLSPEHPLEEWFAEFDALRDRSPSFFINRPIVLDVGPLKLDRNGLQTLVADLFKRKVRVMGVEGAKASALGLGLPPALSGGRLIEDMPEPEEEPKPEAKPTGKADAKAEAKTPTAAEPATPTATAPSLLIAEPVRSGQSIMFPEGDVTIVGSVASGAEVVAGGSIHIYGALRGRALAGIAGNQKARIFSRRFEAELVAIDGLYQTADELDPDLRGRPIQIWLEGDTMMMAAHE